MSGSVGTLWNNKYLTVLSSQLDCVAGIFESVFLTSRNYEDGAYANLQYSVSAGVTVSMTVSLEIILSLHTRSFRSMPASTQPFLNQNTYNTITGYSNRCAFLGLIHIVKDGMSTTLVSH